MVFCCVEVVGDFDDVCFGVFLLIGVVFVEYVGYMKCRGFYVYVLM